MSPPAQVIKTARALGRANSHTPWLQFCLRQVSGKQTENCLYLGYILGKGPRDRGRMWDELPQSVKGRGVAITSSGFVWVSASFLGKKGTDTRGFTDCLSLLVGTTDSECSKPPSPGEGGAGWLGGCCDFCWLPPLCLPWQAARLVSCLLLLILL